MHLLLAFILSYHPVLIRNDNIPLRITRSPRWEKPIDLAAYTTFYKVPPGDDPTLADVQKQLFRPFSEKTNERSKGNASTTDITWLSFQISNETSDTIHLLLQCNAHNNVIGYKGTQEIGNNGFLSGIHDPLPIELTPGETATHWIKVVDVIMAVQPIVVELHTPASYFQANIQGLRDVIPLTIVMSLWCGCFLFMGAFAGYQFYLNRDSLFIYYSIFSLHLFWLCMYALSNRLTLDFIHHEFIFLLFISYGFFISRMIELSRTRPIIWKVLKALMAVCVMQELLLVIERFILKAPLIPLVEYYQYQLSIGGLIVMVCLGVIIASKSPIKKFLIAGIISMISIGLVPVIINPYFNNLVGPWEMIVNYPFAFAFAGFVTENFCFAMAIAYRSKLVAIEKDSLQKTYAHQLEQELDERTKEIEAKRKEIEASNIKQLTTRYEQRLLQMETVALRAQMNPHFIFNCLNSIKLYTLENDSIGAADYLTKFSRLIRLVLENSQAEKIPLAVELETLQLYVDMESMRFKNKFTFNIKMDEGLDHEYLDIPPLLIQPYIENAIWHGLMQKEQRGHVDLSIKLNDPQTLRVEIIDDGVGRVKAAEYKTKSATRHKSFGMKVNSERIALINQEAKKETLVTIEDLVAPDGTPAGTKVTLIIAV